MPSKRILSDETIEILIEAIEGRLEDRLDVASADVNVLAPLFNARHELMTLRDRGTTRKTSKPREPKQPKPSPSDHVSLARDVFMKP